MTERTCIEPYDGGIHYGSEDGGAPTCPPTGGFTNLWGFTPRLCAEGRGPACRLPAGNLPSEPAGVQYYLPTNVTKNTLNRGEADSMC